MGAYEQEVLDEWLKLLKEAGGAAGGRIKDAELKTQCREFLAALRQGLVSGGSMDAEAGAFDGVRDLLGRVSRSRASQGFNPSETAKFVFSLKQPLFERLRSQTPGDASAAADGVWELSLLLDQFGLYTMEVYQKTREEVVLRQQAEISELSTPVVKLWEGILALPLIGTLDLLRDTPPGGRSNSAQRLRAVHGAFGVPAGWQLDGGPLLLLDDRVDTGWTLTEAARVLREAGAGPVLPLVLAVDA